MDKIIEAPAPDRFTQDHLGTVWGFTGGSAAAIIPLLKKLDMLGSDGTPTAAYSKFRAKGSRNEAVKHALRAAFPEIFKRSENAEFAKDDKITDILIETTGREKDDVTLRAIRSTFRTIADYLDTSQPMQEPITPSMPDLPQPVGHPSAQHAGFQLGYQINVILPDTRDVEVFDAIFRKLKEHLL